MLQLYFSAVSSLYLLNLASSLDVITCVHYAKKNVINKPDRRYFVVGQGQEQLISRKSLIKQLPIEITYFRRNKSGISTAIFLHNFRDVWRVI